MRRNATLFVLISLLSGFGGTAMALAAGIWILDLTGSAGLAGLASLGTYAPSLAAPWLGALVDRFPRRPLLITVNVAAGLALLALLTVRTAGQIALIYLVVSLRGIGYVLLDAGESALLPAALPPRLLGDVNGWRSSAQEGMKLLAPLAGAALYAWGGARPVVLMCATLPLVSAGLYALLRVRPTDSPAEHRSALGWRGVRAGFTTLWREPLRTPVLIAAAAIAASGLTTAALLARLVELELPTTRLGPLGSAQGAGAIVGGIAVGRLLTRLPAARVAGGGAVLFAAGCVLWSLPWWPSLIAGSVLAGLGLPATLIAGVTAVQIGTPEHLLGRVSATADMLMFGPTALAIPVGAALVHHGGRVPL